MHLTMPCYLFQFAIQYAEKRFPWSVPLRISGKAKKHPEVTNLSKVVSLLVCLSVHLAVFVCFVFLQNSKFPLPGIMITCDCASSTRKKVFLSIYLTICFRLILCLQVPSADKLYKQFRPMTLGLIWIQSV